MTSATILHAADAIREILSHKEALTASALTGQVMQAGYSATSATKAIGLLREEGWIAHRRQGARVWYSLNPEPVERDTHPMQQVRIEASKAPRMTGRRLCPMGWIVKHMAA